MEQETILVVDDNKEIVYSISELLKYVGYQTIGAYDGMQALDVLEQNNRAAGARPVRAALEKAQQEKEDAT